MGNAQLAEWPSPWLQDHFLIVLLLIGTVFNVIWLLKTQDRLRFRIPLVLLLSLLHTVFGVGCVKFFAFLESGDAGGMSLFGGVFFMPVFYFLITKLTKRKAADVFDVFTICMIFTVMCARINCMMSGCCRGLIIPGTQLRFPTRELEIIYYIGMLLLLIPWVRKRAHTGEIYPIYMATYGAFRFVTEFVRVSDSSTLVHLAHFWAALALAVGLSICGERQNQKGKNKKKREIEK